MHLQENDYASAGTLWGGIRTIDCLIIGPQGNTSQLARPADILLL